MTPRSFGSPTIIKAGAASVPLTRLELRSAKDHDLDEVWLQEALFREPTLVPAALIHASFDPLIPVCRELATDAGRIDILYVTPKGDLVIVETKLWRNPQARREVIGQILNYASELSRWTYEDLQRMLASHLKRPGNALYDLVRERHSDVDEKTFCDNVARSLRLGQFLLLVVGDGIQEGARQIADFLVDKSSLAFHLGMVDMEAYEIPDLGRLIVPRIQVRTEVIRRFVLLSGGQADALETDAGTEQAEEDGPKNDEASARRRANAERFWSDVLEGLHLDDQTQPMAKPPKGGNLSFPPPPDTDASIKAWFAINNNDRAGVYVKLGKSAQSLELYRALEMEKQALEEELGQPLEFSISGGAPYIAASRNFGDVSGRDRDAVLAYLRTTINKFVNTFRHRIKRWRVGSGDS
jgi:hypothetical protein